MGCSFDDRDRGESHCRTEILSNSFPTRDWLVGLHRVGRRSLPETER